MKNGNKWKSELSKKRKKRPTQKLKIENRKQYWQQEYAISRD